MKAIKRITALALCALMLLGLLSGCGEKKQGDEKFVLNVSVCNVIDSLDPAMNTDADADSVFYALYENLMRESDDGEHITTFMYEELLAFKRAAETLHLTRDDVADVMGRNAAHLFGMAE